MFSTRPETSLEVDRLADLLAALPFGGVLDYAAMSAAIGYDIKRRSWLMLRAQHRVEKRDGTRFGNVHGIGLKKLAAADVAGIGAAGRRRIGRTARVASQRLTGLSYNDIDRSTQTRIDAERSLLGAISMIAGSAALKTVEPAIVSGPEVAMRVIDILKAAAK